MAGRAIIKRVTRSSRFKPAGSVLGTCGNGADASAPHDAMESLEGGVETSTLDQPPTTPMSPTLFVPVQGLAAGDQPSAEPPRASTVARADVAVPGAGTSTVLTCQRGDVTSPGTSAVPTCQRDVVSFPVTTGSPSTVAVSTGQRKDVPFHVSSVPKAVNLSVSTRQRDVLPSYVSSEGPGTVAVSTCQSDAVISCRFCF
jgi:hypothetical protein